MFKLDVLTFIQWISRMKNVCIEMIDQSIQLAKCTERFQVTTASTVDVAST